MEDARLRALLDVGGTLLAELDLEGILARLLQVARELTSARYAAIGVLDDERREIERFVTAGIDEATHAAIGDLPRGRGVLGELIRDPVPLRVADVGEHPRSFGFPAAHPPMGSFLGVPILIRGAAWGNLYLTEREGGPFTAEDEEAVVVLAGWAAIAVENARLYRDASRRRDELEQANRRLATTIELSRGLGGTTDPDRVLELVVKRSRALLDARAVELAVLEGDVLHVVAAAGEGARELRGLRIPLDESAAGVAVRRRATHRFDELPPTMALRRIAGARRAVATPLTFRDQTVGVLVVGDDEPFGPEDERLIEAFAASAAAAVATARNARNEALRRALGASEEERRRWARELHDTALQDLIGVRTLLAAAREGDPADVAEAVDASVTLLGDSATALRALISDLRPPTLDTLGVQAALESLAVRVEQLGGVEVDLDVELPAPRLDPEVENTVFRLVQEALTNVVKHAGARRVAVGVAARDGGVEVLVRDDGAGFDADAATAGHGLLGMRERLALVGGTLEVRTPAGGGTVLRAGIPLRG